VNRKRAYSQDNAALYKRYQLELDKSVAEFESRARKQPFHCADEAWFTTQTVLRYLRKKGLRQYGVDVEDYGLRILSFALEPAEDGSAPRNGTLGACTVAVYYDPTNLERFLHSMECLRVQGEGKTTFPEPPATLVALLRAKDRRAALDQVYPGGSRDIFPYEEEALIERGELVPRSMVVGHELGEVLEDLSEC
jgi:hypothetical protein